MNTTPYEFIRKILKFLVELLESMDKPLEGIKSIHENDDYWA